MHEFSSDSLQCSDKDTDSDSFPFPFPFPFPISKAVWRSHKLVLILSSSKILGPKIAQHNVSFMKIPVIFVFYDINLEKINTKWGTVYVLSLIHI